MSAQQQQQGKFAATIACFMAHALNTFLLQRSPEYYSEFGYHRMRVDRRIRIEYATRGRKSFESGKKKLRIHPLHPPTRSAPEYSNVGTQREADTISVF